MLFACSSACSIAGGCSPRPEKACARAASALTVCPAGAVVQGIDVSSYQGAVSWPQARASGITFAFARVSDGATVPDAQFAGHWRAMKSAGVIRGAYQFFRASEDPTAQAGVALSMLAGAGGREPGDLPLVMDIETADGESDATVRARMATWIDAVARGTGAPPLVYTNAATSTVIGAAFAGDPLWVAGWDTTCPTMPGGWTAWKFWQYSSTGSVAGVPAAVDLDEYNGTLADLLSFAGGPQRDDAGMVPGEADAGDAAASAPDASAQATGDAGAAMGSAGAGSPAQSGACSF